MAKFDPLTGERLDPEFDPPKPKPAAPPAPAQPDPAPAAPVPVTQPEKGEHKPQKGWK